MRSVKTPRGRRSRRLALLGGGGLAAAAIAGVVLLAVPPAVPPSQTAGPSLPPGQGPASVGDDGLPKPATSYVVLLVEDPADLDEREVRWIGDLRRAYDRAEVLGYGAATAEALAAYRTIFVIAESPDLDTVALASAFANGASVHLIGAAAGYRGAIAGGTS